MHNTWWDLLCDVSTGQITTGALYGSGSPYGASIEENPERLFSIDSNDKEKDLIANDLEFMQEVNTLLIIIGMENDFKSLFRNSN